MTQKAERGTKRTCQSCSGHFYDLNREEIACPMCGVAFVIEVPEEIEEPVVVAAEEKPAETVVEPTKTDDDDSDGDVIAEDGDDLADIETDDSDVANDDDEDAAILTVDDPGDTDVTGIIGGPISKTEEES